MISYTYSSVENPVQVLPQLYHIAIKPCHNFDKTKANWKATNVVYYSKVNRMDLVKRCFGEEVKT